MNGYKIFNLCVADEKQTVFEIPENSDTFNKEYVNRSDLFIKDEPFDFSKKCFNQVHMLTRINPNKNIRVPWKDSNKKDYGEWTAYVKTDIFNCYYLEESDRKKGTPRDFMLFETSLFPIKGVRKKDGQSAALANFITWQQFLERYHLMDKPNRPNDLEEDIVSRLYKLSDAYGYQDRDSKPISENIFAILIKVAKETGYARLPEDEKRELEKAASESPKIYRLLRTAKNVFISRKIFAPYMKDIVISKKGQPLGKAIIEYIIGLSKNIDFSGTGDPIVVPMDSEDEDIKPVVIEDKFSEDIQFLHMYSNNKSIGLSVSKAIREKWSYIRFFVDKQNNPVLEKDMPEPVRVKPMPVRLEVPEGVTGVHFAIGDEEKLSELRESVLNNSKYGDVKDIYWIYYSTVDGD